MSAAMATTTLLTNPLRDVDELVTRACERAGLDDFGGDAWREGLQAARRYVRVRARRQSPAGANTCTASSSTRCGIGCASSTTCKRHPEVADEQVERPLVVLGLPRTGTSLASYLLDQDPLRRSLLTWEAEDSVPPSTPETLRTDPAVPEEEGRTRRARRRTEGGEHPDGALGRGRRSHRVPVRAEPGLQGLPVGGVHADRAYADWLSAGRHGERLRVRADRCCRCCSRAHPACGRSRCRHTPCTSRRCCRRSPTRGSCGRTATRSKSTASFLRLNYLSRAVLGADVDVDVIVPNVLRQLQEHVDRPLATRRRIGDDRFFDLHYADLMRDPVGVMRSLYEWAGDDLTERRPSRRCSTGSSNHPQDRFGVAPYSLEGSGVTRLDLEPIFDEYLSTFDIELEE